MAFDGTFWIVPSLFYQLFTIFIMNGRHFSPAIFFLMTGKSQSLYQACFLKISELIPEFSPNFAISDFETASRSAFRNVWATAHISGCFFHFANAVFRHLKNNGLGNMFKNNQQFHKWAKALMAVPLLREEDIRPTVELLLNQGFEVSPEENSLIQRFRVYFRRQWLIRVSAAELSVFNESVKTNNGSESNHAHFKRLIKSHKPNIWSFHKSLNKIIQDSKINQERIQNGVQVEARPKLRYLRNEQNRERAKQRLLSDQYEPLQYLYAVSHGLDTHLINLQNRNEEMEDNDIMEPEVILVELPEELEQPALVCVVCYGLGMGD